MIQVQRSIIIENILLSFQKLNKKSFEQQLKKIEVHLLLKESR